MSDDPASLIRARYFASGITPTVVADFQMIILQNFRENPRIFPWRETHDPYAILVSEVMLQQTQADRVVPKYLAFLKAFPNFAALAHASLPELFSQWQGLGYNRRVLALQKTAQAVVAEFDGQLPSEEDKLRSLPGIGPYTAAAIRAFAFELPSAFIETNIRRLYIHFFFPEAAEAVHDKELFPLIEATLPSTSPREWYYALMDYGAKLAKELPNPNRRSKHYAKQSKFTGSNRQLRGQILKRLLRVGQQSIDVLGLALEVEKPRLMLALEALRLEGFLELDDTSVSLK